MATSRHLLPHFVYLALKSYKFLVSIMSKKRNCHRELKQILNLYMSGTEGYGKGYGMSEKREYSILRCMNLEDKCLTSKVCSTKI